MAWGLDFTQIVLNVKNPQIRTIYLYGKRFQTLSTVVQSNIWLMGAVKTIQALGRPALNSHYEEQCAHPTLLEKQAMGGLTSSERGASNSDVVMSLWLRRLQLADMNMLVEKTGQMAELQNGQKMS